jgi:hypothetical protein
MESMRWVGVDVHANESLAAVLNPATGEIDTQRISGRPTFSDQLPALEEMGTDRLRRT